MEKVRTSVYRQLENGAYFELDRSSLKEKVNGSIKVDFVRTPPKITCSLLEGVSPYPANQCRHPETI
jgi:hypothetical protein